MLTEAEHKAVAMLADLWNLFVTEVVLDGPARDSDLREIAADIHALQYRVMAQCASRNYPDLYRPLGGAVAVPTPPDLETGEQ